MANGGREIPQGEFQDPIGDLLRAAKFEALLTQQDATDVSRRVQAEGEDTVLTPEQIAKFLGELALDFSPGVGDVKAAAFDAPEQFARGENIAGGISVLSAIPLFGFFGDLLKLFGRGGRAAGGAADITPQLLEELIGSTRLGPGRAGPVGESAGGRVVGEITTPGTGFTRRGQDPQMRLDEARRLKDRPRTVLDNNIKNLLDEKDEIMRTVGDLTQQQGERSLQISRELDELFRLRGSSPRSNFGRQQRILAEEQTLARGGGPPDIGPSGRSNRPAELTDEAGIRRFFDEIEAQGRLENDLFREFEATRRATSEGINREIFEGLRRQDPFGEAEGIQANVIKQIEELIMRRITPGQVGAGSTPAGLLGPGENAAEVLRALLEAFNKPPG